jgi:hypothetical protein
MSYADEVLADLRYFADDDLPEYTDCLREAFDSVTPVFTRARYAEFFWHCAKVVPAWLSQVVIANAQAESEGSAKLLGLWRSITFNERVELEVLAHARDEAGHSQLFVTLGLLAFPGAISVDHAQALRSTLTKIPADATVERSAPIDELLLIDHLVQMNIGEIRTRFHMHLLGPAIYHCTPLDDRLAAERILQGLASDEVRHIGYTARLMEAWCRDGAKKRIANLYAQRLREFHELTVRQTEAAIEAFGQGMYPDLLEI